MIRRLFSIVSSIKLYGEKPLNPEKTSRNLQNSQKIDYSLPRPHAIRMNESNSEVLSYKLPNRPLWPLHEVPVEALVQFFPYFESPPDSKLLRVAVLGAPNAGKSSLINAILGSRFLSVSRKINTTHSLQTGMKTSEKTQLVFNDTPGIISTHSSLTNQISSKGWESLSESDIALFVVDAAKILRDDVKSACSRLQKLLAKRGKSSLPEARIAGESPAQYEERLKKAPVQIPAYLVMNKVDLVEDRRRVKRIVNELKEYACFAGEFYVSAESKYNVKALEQALEGLAYPAEWEYHPLQRTSLPDAETASEVVREQVMNYVHDELPYRWIYRTVGWTPFLDGSLFIEVDVQVKTDVHKGILIGRGGMVIKKICHAAENWLSHFFQRKVRLQITPKIMGEKERKATYKGFFVQMTPPHTQERNELSKEQMKELKMVE
jgi:GTP-binding protein Era